MWGAVKAKKVLCFYRSMSQSVAYSSSKAKPRSTQRKVWKPKFSVTKHLQVWWLCHSSLPVRFLKNKKRYYQNTSNSSILEFPGLPHQWVEEEGPEVQRLVPSPGNILIFQWQWGSAGKSERKKIFFKGLAIAGCGPRPGEISNSTQIPKVYKIIPQNNFMQPK